MKKKWKIWTHVWNELKRSEGGRGMQLIADLKAKGIPARRCHSPYVGHIGIEVPSRYAKGALRYC